ncbi:hypothetical protein [Neisseria sicca]|nr:hypothetical protein [Neisseria sicca]
MFINRNRKKSSENRRFKVSDDLISTLPLTQIKCRQIPPLPIRPVRG